MDIKAYKQKLAAAGETGDQWQREAGSWFDGSVESIDRRLASCKLLLARAQEAAGRDLGNRKHLAAIGDLKASQAYLAGLREDLLTASVDKTAAPGELPGFSPPDPPPNINENLKGPWGQDTAAGRNPLEQGSLTHGLIHGGSLSHADARFVALEGATFYRANGDADTEELLIRAKNHAELQTSTRSKADSRAITSAFVQKVAALAEDRPRLRRVASVPQTVAGPDEVLFM